MKTKNTINNQKQHFYFVSYSRSDRNRVRQLAAHIATHGIELWIDESLRYGQIWSDELTSKIESSDGLIIIVSHAARESLWVQRELALADELRKPIYPILIEQINRPFLDLMRLHYVDLTNGGFPPDEFILNLAEIYNHNSSSVWKGYSDVIY